MLGTAIWITKENKQHKKVWDSSTPGPKGYNLHVMISPPSREKQKNWVDIKTKSQVKIKGYLYQLWKQKFQETVPSFVCKSYHSQMLRCYLKLSLRQPEQKKKKSKVICQARYFHIAFLNQKTLWKEVTATVTESVSLRYNMRGFTPALIPASAMKFKSSSTSCAQQRPPQHRLGAPLVPLVLLLVQLGRALTSPVPTKAQLLHWCCQLQAIQTGPITDQSVSGENGLLSSQITQIQGILQLFGFWAHIPELLVPLMMWSLPGETSAVFHLMVYLSSTSLHHTQQGLFHLCPLLSTSPAREHNQRPAWGRNTREHWEKPQKPW